MTTQMQHYETSRKAMADRNEVFLEMVNHPTNPLTGDDLRKLIVSNPSRWQQFESWIPKLSLPQQQSHGISARNGFTGFEDGSEPKL